MHAQSDGEGNKHEYYSINDSPDTTVTQYIPNLIAAAMETCASTSTLCYNYSRCSACGVSSAHGVSSDANLGANRLRKIGDKWRGGIEDEGWEGDREGLIVDGDSSGQGREPVIADRQVLGLEVSLCCLFCVLPDAPRAQHQVSTTRQVQKARGAWCTTCDGV